MSLRGVSSFSVSSSAATSSSSSSSSSAQRPQFFVAQDLAYGPPSAPPPPLYPFAPTPLRPSAFYPPVFYLPQPQPQPQPTAVKPAENKQTDLQRLSHEVTSFISHLGKLSTFAAKLSESSDPKTKELAREVNELCTDFFFRIVALKK